MIDVSELNLARNQKSALIGIGLLGQAHATCLNVNSISKSARLTGDVAPDSNGVYKTTYMCICNHVSISIYPSIYRSIYLYIHTFIHPSIHPSIHVYVRICKLLFCSLSLSFSRCRDLNESATVLGERRSYQTGNVFSFRTRSLKGPAFGYQNRPRSGW